MRKPSKVVGITMAGLLVLAGCGDPSSSKTSTAASSGSTGQAVSKKNLVCDKTVAVADIAGYPVPKAKKRYKITLLEATRTGYYFQSLAYGATTAAAQAGVDINVVAGDGFSSPAVQLQQAENALQRGTDALLLQASDFKGSVPVIRAAQAKHIPVIAVGTQVDDNVNQVIQDDYGYGQTLADQVNKALHGRSGDGIFMAGPATATWATKRTEGFADQVKAKYPNIKIVASPQTDLDPARGLAAFENAAQKAPNLAWIASVYDYILPGISLPPAYKGKVKYVSGSIEPSVIQGLASGAIYSAISTEPIGAGRIGLADIVTILDGGHAPKTHCLAAAVYAKADLGSASIQGELLPADRK